MRRGTTGTSNGWAGLLTAVALIAAGWPCGAAAGERTVYRSRDIDQWHTNRIIVKWRSTGVAAMQIARVEDRAARLSQTSGIHFTPARNIFGHTDVMLLDYIPSHSDMQEILARLSADPSIEYAEPDEVRFIQQATPPAPPPPMPNDPRFYASTDPQNAGNPDASIGSWVGQWYLLPTSSTTPSAISANAAWALSTGANIRVAIIDTGIAQDHPDLAANIEAPGYDFVSCDQGNFTSTTTTALGATQGIDECTASGSAATYFFSNENQNWNPDGTDPGDFIDTDELALAEFKSQGCTATAPSSWHGTKVAGVLGAVTNNGIGIAGVAPNVTMISARVLGSCRGGLVSDIAAAILWASGQDVTISTGTISLSPAADILNLSLGALNPCSATEQDAINAAVNAGVIVVAAAGNEGGALDAPANCTGVVSVVALRHTGDKVPFSNLGSANFTPTIAAPGGNCVNALATEPCLYDIETTTDASETTPSATPDFYTYSLLDASYLNSGGNPSNEQQTGTSFAAPMVAGVAALMKASMPNLTAGQIIARLQSSALPFPTSSPGSSPKPGNCPLADDSAGSGGSFTEPATPFECLCTTATCGAGMLNALAAVQAANAAFVQITPSSTTGLPGQKISLNGTGSTAAKGHTIASYLWTTTPAISDQLINANQAIATLVVPSFRSIGVTLTITDDAGTSTSASIEIQSAFDAGHKSGALQPAWLTPLALLALWQIQRRRRTCGKPLN
jgi:serine protease